MARPAQAGRFGQIAPLLEAFQQGRDHRADGPGVHPAVGVAADVAVDGAALNARAAADAVKDFLYLPPRRRERPLSTMTR